MSDSTLRIIVDRDCERPDTQTGSLPWPGMMAFLTAWLLPATTARHTRTLPLLHAYGVHLLAGVATFLLIVALVGIDERRDVTTVLANDILREFDRDWQEALLITMLVVFLVEGGFLALALVVLPWGAADEPLRSSWAHALRHTWLHSTHALPAVLIIGLLVIGNDHMGRAYNSRPQTIPVPTFTMPPAAPTPPLNPTTQQSNDYQKAFADWQKQVNDTSRQYTEAWRTYHQSRPFLIRYGEVFVVQIGFFVGVWVLWALFRAVGAARPIAPIQRPPTCEFCGYNLVATPSNSRCPECGELVAASLGPSVRPGPAWERRQDLGTLRAWWETESQPILSPGRFGRTVRVCSLNMAHRLFLVGHLPIVFVAAGAATVLSSLAMSSGSLWEEDDGIILWGVAPMLGITSAAACLALAMLAAAFVGLIHTLHQKRNLLPATAKIGSYLAGYLTLWVCFASAWCVLTCMLIKARVFNVWRRPYGIPEEFLAFSFWAGPTLAGFLVYVVLLWKATSSTRHANN
ncbi:MAG TPA: hypothetical protein PKY77_21580 [Phycisphaerae bacterium]|nr:hypothetical protein [Phycisphaerae bacterium]HRY66769.1 hypothetical protein [Phycisphaerae bacterium]